MMICILSQIMVKKWIVEQVGGMAIQAATHNKRPSETYLFRRPCLIEKPKTYFAADAAAGAGALAGVLLGTEAAEAA